MGSMDGEVTTREEDDLEGPGQAQTGQAQGDQIELSGLLGRNPPNCEQGDGNGDKDSAGPEHAGFIDPDPDMSKYR